MEGEDTFQAFFFASHFVTRTMYVSLSGDHAGN